VQDEHQVTIVKQGGLLLLIPLMTKGDVEVQRLAAHAVANLAVNGQIHLGFAALALLHWRCCTGAAALALAPALAACRCCLPEPSAC
jgi:hypothetical protein